jgi:hypothetical protein
MSDAGGFEEVTGEKVVECAFHAALANNILGKKFEVEAGRPFSYEGAKRSEPARCMIATVVQMIRDS